MMLWIRHVRLLPALVSALGAAALVRFLTFWFFETDQGRTTLAPLWASMALVLPLTMVFTTENPWDRVAVRPVVRRRAALIAVAAALSVVVAFVGFPDNAVNHGSLATLRNCLGLLGVGLLFLTVVPPWAVWVVPAVLGFLSMPFQAPWAPSVTETVWSSLRMPGTLTTEAGGRDISWWVCLAVFVVGSVSYLLRWRLPTVVTGQEQVKQRAEGGAAYRRGMRRAMLLPLMVAVPVVAVLWTLGAQLPYWGGSPHLLLVENVPYLLAFTLSITFTGGVIAGQYRWRSSVAVWEQLSGRPTAAKIWQALGPMLGWLAVGIAGAALVGLAVAAGGALVDGVSVTVVLRDILESIALPVVIVVAVILSGGIGVIIGTKVRGIWLPPVGLVAVTVAGFTLITVMSPTSERAYYADLSDDNVVCTGEGPEVCAVDYDAGYLHAAAATVDELYASSVFADDLLRRVYVVDKIWAGGDRPGPLIALSRERGITAPESLDPQVVFGSVESSITQACVPAGTGSGEVGPYLLPGIDQIYSPEPDNVELVRSSLRQAADCFADAGQ